MLIRAYGEMWNPEIVDWGSRGQGNEGRLLGKVKIDGANLDVNFWDAVGLYVLYDNFKPVYIGKAYGTRLGPRLRHHISDRLVGRWDMFSWYTLSTVNKTTGTVRRPGTRLTNPETILSTLEAVTILITEPPLNRKRESIPNALEAIQIGGEPRAIRSYLEEILENVTHNI